MTRNRILWEPLLAVVVISLLLVYIYQVADLTLVDLLWGALFVTVATTLTSIPMFVFWRRQDRCSHENVAVVRVCDHCGQRL